MRLSTFRGSISWTTHSGCQTLRDRSETFRRIKKHASVISIPPLWPIIPHYETTSIAMLILDTNEDSFNHLFKGEECDQLDQVLPLEGGFNQTLQPGLQPDSQRYPLLSPSEPLVCDENTMDWGLGSWADIRMGPLGRAGGKPNQLSFYLKHMDDSHQCVQKLDRIGVRDSALYTFHNNGLSSYLSKVS